MSIKKGSTSEELIKERKKRIFSLRSLVLVLFSIAILILLFKDSNFIKIGQLLASANVVMLGLVLLLYAFSNFLKGLRLRLILGDKKSLINYFVITGFHNFFNQVLPARTGEITLVYYLNRLASIKVGQGLYSLVVVRIMDLLVVAIYFFVSFALLTWGNVDLKWLIAASLLVCLSVLLLLTLPLFVQVGKNIFNKLSIALCMKGTIVNKISDFIDSLEHGFSTGNLRNAFVPVVLVTIFIWAALYGLFYISILAVGIDLSLLQSVAGSTGAVLTNVLPVNGVGGFGSHEAGWAGGFVLVGLSKESALATAITSHLLIFSSSIIMALVSLLIKKVFFEKDLSKMNN